ELAQSRIELFFGPLAHAAGVDDDDIGIGGVGGGFETRLLEEAGHAFGVVEVHLTSERLDEISTRHGGLSLSLFRFRLSACVRLWQPRASMPPGAARVEVAASPL